MSGIASIFDQPPPHIAARQRITTLSGGIAEFGPLRQSERDAVPASNELLPTQQGITESIDANTAAVAIRFQTLSTPFGASHHAATFGDMLPKPTLELERIRDFLAEGLFNDARAAIAQARKVFPSDESLAALSKLTALQSATRVATQFQSKQQEFRWLEEHRTEYLGRWVALRGHELLASGETMKQVLDAIAAKGIDGAPLIHKVR